MTQSHPAYAPTGAVRQMRVAAFSFDGAHALQFPTGFPRPFYPFMYVVSPLLVFGLIILGLLKM